MKINILKLENVDVILVDFEISYIKIYIFWLFESIEKIKKDIKNTKISRKLFYH